MKKLTNGSVGNVWLDICSNFLTVRQKFIPGLLSRIFPYCFFTRSLSALRLSLHLDKIAPFLPKFRSNSLDSLTLSLGVPLQLNPIQE